MYKASLEVQLELNQLQHKQLMQLQDYDQVQQYLQLDVTLPISELLLETH